MLDENDLRAIEGLFNSSERRLKEFFLSELAASQLASKKQFSSLKRQINQIKIEVLEIRSALNKAIEYFESEIIKIKGRIGLV